MQGMSFLVAWMTSEARTELTEKASSLEHRQDRGTSGHVLLYTCSLSSFHSPQVQHQTGCHTWLSRPSLRNIVEEEFTV